MDPPVALAADSEPYAPSRQSSMSHSRAQRVHDTHVLILGCIAELQRLNERPLHIWDVGYLVRWAARVRLSNVQQVLLLASATKGVDKLAKLAQYAAQLCGAVLPLPAYSMERARHAEKHISRTRKTMRLLKFAKGLKDAHKAWSSSKGHSPAVRFVHLATYVSSSVYYALDHVLWAIDVALYRVRRADRARWKRYKNLASVSRLVFRFFQIVNYPESYRRQEHELWQKLHDIVAAGGDGFEGADFDDGDHDFDDGSRDFDDGDHDFDDGSHDFDGDDSHHGRGDDDGDGTSDDTGHGLRQRCREHGCHEFDGGDGDGGRAERLAGEVAQIAKQLRALRAKNYFLMLDMFEWWMNFLLLGRALRWFSIQKGLAAAAGVFASLVGIYRLWLAVYRDDVAHVTHVARAGGWDGAAAAAAAMGAKASAGTPSPLRRRSSAYSTASSASSASVSSTPAVSSLRTDSGLSATRSRHQHLRKLGSLVLSRVVMEQSDRVNLLPLTPMNAARARNGSGSAVGRDNNDEQLT